MVPVNLIRSGYTLPVFACAAAVAALHWLQQGKSIQLVQIDLIEPPQTVEIPVEQIAGLRQGMALAITRSDPGDNLDLTRNTPIWALVELVGERGSRGAEEQGSRGAGEQRSRGVEERRSGGAEEAVVIKGGEGLGRQSEGGEAAIYAYAQKLLRENLGKLLESGEKIEVTIILQKGDVWLNALLTLPLVLSMGFLYWVQPEFPNH
jgi:cobalt-precorrin-5B (C1)-methyltransferase